MDDPVGEVIETLRQNPRLRSARLNRNFLHNVAEVFEREGFATTRLFLNDKKGQSQTRVQAEILLQEVLPALERCSRIVHNRAIGRYVIKALAEFQQGGQQWQ